MKIPVSFRSAELLTEALCLSITDCVVEAGCDAEVTLERMRQASAFAHELARFLDNCSTALAGEIVIDDDTDEQHELRAAVANRYPPLSIASVTPLIRVGGDEPEAA
jgi:hypothetical protein